MFPWHLSERRGAHSCACPSGSVSVVEDVKPHCRRDMCGVAPVVNHATKNDTDKITALTRSATCDAGHTVQDVVLDAPTEWTVSCDAGGAFRAVHTGYPGKCTFAGSRQR